ncbi:extensin-like domain-containing protein [Belnapia arida]|uniref:extensin-like domain-containing protein n=1 Tax=Belnapia arida TaxID=2804533 RepID=UPI002E2B44DD|nr:extensin family protein [Belnapia arida]
MTSLKLSLLARRPEACFAAFEASGLTLRRVPDRPSDTSCEVENAVLLPAGIRIMPLDPVVTCRMAAAWVLFERHALQPASRKHFGVDVTGLRHLGTYNCRNVYHAAAGRRSQHATANAIDLASFILSDGQEIAIPREWNGIEPKKAFLREVRDGACLWFNTVLGPDYNAAHADHLHLDMGPLHTCR